jgi:hypothetical protein
VTDTAIRPVGPVALAAAAATLYTVPTGSTVILRHIRIANTTAGAVTFTLSIGTDAAGKRLASGKSIPANDIWDWSGFIVMLSTEIIQGFASAATSLTITVSGVEVK